MFDLLTRAHRERAERAWPLVIVTSSTSNSNDVQVEHVEDVGLVTASLDGKIYVFDVARDGVMHEVTHHVKAVHDFAYCRPYSLFASCSERRIVLWQAQTGHLVSELAGHLSAVTHLAMDNECEPSFDVCAEGRLIGGCFAHVPVARVSACPHSALQAVPAGVDERRSRDQGLGPADQQMHTDGVCRALAAA